MSNELVVKSWRVRERRYGYRSRHTCWWVEVQCRDAGGRFWLTLGRNARLTNLGPEYFATRDEAEETIAKAVLLDWPLRGCFEEDEE